MLDAESAHQFGEGPEVVQVLPQHHRGDGDVETDCPGRLYSAHGAVEAPRRPHRVVALGTGAIQADLEVQSFARQRRHACCQLAIHQSAVGEDDRGGAVVAGDLSQQVRHIPPQQRFAAGEVEGIRAQVTCLTHEAEQPV